MPNSPFMVKCPAPKVDAKEDEHADLRSSIYVGFASKPRAPAASSCSSCGPVLRKPMVDTSAQDVDIGSEPPSPIQSSQYYTSSGNSGDSTDSDLSDASDEGNLNKILKATRKYELGAATSSGAPFEDVSVCGVCNSSSSSSESLSSGVVSGSVHSGSYDSVFGYHSVAELSGGMSDSSDSMAPLDESSRGAMESEKSIDDTEAEKKVKKKTVPQYPRLDADNDGPFGKSTIRLVNNPLVGGGKWNSRTAYCGWHEGCTASRTLNAKKDVPAQGRAAGLLMGFLRRAHKYGNKQEHKNALKDMKRKHRVKGRNFLKSCAESDDCDKASIAQQILDAEAKKLSDNDSDEPMDCP